MANTPNIRFKGFTDDWEQRKLGEMCNFINGDRSNNYPNATDFQEKGIPFVGSDSLGMTYINKNKLRFITFEKYYQMKGLKIQKGDILYTLRGAGFGKCSISDFSEGTVASSLVGIRCSEELLKPPFLIQWLNSANAESEKKKTVNGSTAQNISVEDMKLYIIYTPSMEEQEKISEYLLNLDNLITLHQRKCDETKELKKYMLQKMFPQNGKKIPEIRFAGFTDDWEQRKWIDTVDISTEMVNPSNDEYDDMPHIAPGNIESFTGRILDNVKTVKEEQLVSGKFRFRPGDVVYGKINPQLGKYFYASVHGLTSADAYVLNSKNGLTQQFLFSLLQTDEFFKYSISVSKRSGMPKINRDELNAYNFLMPIEAEQVKIGKFLLSLDHLITLHQRKCDETKELKKFMLQNMFPQKG